MWIFSYACLNIKENFEFAEVFVQFAPRITLLCTFLCFGSVLWKIRHSIEEIWTSIMENTDFFNVFHIAVSFGLCLCLFSNSYVVEESHVYSFSALSLVILHLCKNNLIFQSKRSFFLGMLFLGLIRLTTIYFRCREEQQAYCHLTDFHKPLHTLDNLSVSREYKSWRFLSTIISGK